MNAKESLYPNAQCSASVSGFVVRIWFPLHPDGEDNLYPKPICGLQAREWLSRQAGVQSVVETSEGENYGYQVIVLAAMSPDEQTEYANFLRAALNSAGFCW